MAKMRVGIIGAGRIAVVMAETLRKMRGVEAYAIASRSLEKAQAFAFEHGMTKAYGSYEEMLQDKKLDLVYIATPHTLHLTLQSCVSIMERPVLVEKPFCDNAQSRGAFVMQKKRESLLRKQSGSVIFRCMRRSSRHWILV